MPAWLLSAAIPVGAAEEKGKAEKTAPVYPVALFPFQERGGDARGEGSKVTDLLFAKLAADPGLALVDREDIRKLVDEQEVNLSGLVNPQQAIKVGQITGARFVGHRLSPARR